MKHLLSILSPQPPEKEKQEKTSEHRVSFLKHSSMSSQASQVIACIQATCRLYERIKLNAVDSHDRV